MDIKAVLRTARPVSEHAGRFITDEACACAIEHGLIGADIAVVISEARNSG